MLAIFLLISLAHACTYFEVPQKEVGLVIGRSMELGDLIDDMRWRVVLHSRNESAVFSQLSASQQVERTTARMHRFGFVAIEGAGFHGLPTLSAEGLNEKGLSVSANVLRGSVYESVLTLKPKVSWIEVVPFLLGNFANVTDALAGLRAVAVVGGPEPLHELYSHWALADAAGNSAIVEFLNGELVAKEGPSQHVGVMTNDPPLDWQITNLNQYVNVRPDWPNSNNLIQKHLESGTIPQAVGHGFNLRGLPGDGSPASRFVRVFYLREYAMANMPEAVATQDDAVLLATGLLNNVYLTKGTIAKTSARDTFEYTPWAVIKVPQRGLFLYRTAADLAWKQISLRQLDFSKPTQPSIPLSMTALGIQDVTKLLMPEHQSTLFAV